MTDDITFAKNYFSKGLTGFGKASKAPEPAAEPVDQASNSGDDVIPDSRSAATDKSPVSNIDLRRKAERAASNAGRKGSRPKKLATIGMRCTAKQKMILLALMEHLGSGSQSDVAVEAIMAVAAGYDIKGAADEWDAVFAERIEKIERTAARN